MPSPPALSRRQALLAIGSASTAAMLMPPLSAWAADGVAERADAQYGYRLAYPNDWSDAGKPVKTHLHEVLLSAPKGEGKMKLGITVDPVKIDSLEAFGNLDEVTQRVLGVEEKRDGVTKVTLRANAAEAGDAEAGRPSYYTIEYATVSSRGTKVYCCKYCISKQKLYVLQAQANLDAFDADAGIRSALRDIVRSFEVGAS